MKQLRLLGLVLLAIFAMSAIAAGTASAENPEILPNPTSTKPLTFKGTSPAGELETTKDSVIKCESDTIEGSFTSARSGTVKVDFFGCSSSGIKCNTSGDNAGVVLTNGPIEGVDILPGGVLTLGLKVAITEFEIICGGIVKIKVRGSVIGNVTSLKKSGEDTKTATVVFAKSTLGEQAIQECDLPTASCKGKTFKLESSFGGGFELAAEVTTETVTFGELVAFDY